jgi:ABC-type spermidine/putrescine transport system permease subunit II
MGDRLIVMNDGVIEQVGTAHEIFTAPQTFFVASFVGDNFIMQGEIASANGALVLMFLTALLSTSLAMAFRRKFRGSGALFYMIMTGLMVPGLLVSLGVMLLFKQLGLTTAWYFSGIGFS